MKLFSVSLFAGAALSSPVTNLQDLQNTGNKIAENIHYTQLVGRTSNGKNLYSSDNAFSITSNKVTWNDCDKECMSEFGSDWWCGIPPSKMYKNYPQYTENYWTSIFMSQDGNIDDESKGAAPVLQGYGPCGAVDNFECWPKETNSDERYALGMSILYPYSIDKLSGTVSGCRGQDENDANDTPDCDYDHDAGWGAPSKAQVSFEGFPPNEGGTYIQNNGGENELYSGVIKGKSQQYQAVCVNYKSKVQDQVTYVDEDGWIYQ